MTDPSSRAGERTALAWRRTALAATTAVALFVTHALVTGWGVSAAVAFAAALTLFAIVLLCVVRNRSLARGRWHGDRSVVLLAAITTVVVALLALAMLAV